MKKFIRDNSWWIYFILAYLISWPVWIIGNLLLPSNLTVITKIIGAFGPMAAAMILLGIMEGRPALKTWFKNTFNFRINILWYLLGGIALPFLIAGTHHLIYLMLGGQSGLNFNLSWLTYFAYLIPTALLTGGNEEPGWRGFITPVLQKRFNPLLSFIITGTGWAVWHSPFYFSGNWGGSDQPFLWLLLYCIPLSVILTWLYDKSGKSIIPAMLLHAGTNVVFRFFPMETKVLDSVSDEFTVIKTIVYWIIAILILILSKEISGYRKRYSLSEKYKFREEL